MMLEIPFSIYFGDDDIPALLIAGIGTSLTGFSFWFTTRKTNKLDLGKREGYLIVTLGWVTVRFRFTAICNPWLHSFANRCFF